jgi:hypothetical protein
MRKVKGKKKKAKVNKAEGKGQKYGARQKAIFV